MKFLILYFFSRYSSSTSFDLCLRRSCVICLVTSASRWLSGSSRLSWFLYNCMRNIRSAQKSSDFLQKPDWNHSDRKILARTSFHSDSDTSSSWWSNVLLLKRSNFKLTSTSISVITQSHPLLCNLMCPLIFIYNIMKITQAQASMVCILTAKSHVEIWWWKN